MNHYELFGCKYPIVAAPMNKVSDLGLAVACFNAGIFPSLSLYTYFSIDGLRLNLFDQALREYKLITGSNKILVSLLTSDVFDKKIQKVLIQNQVTHLEIIDDKNIVDSEIWDTVVHEIKFLQDQGIKIFLKALTSRNTTLEIDGIILKGSKGAGRGLESIDIDHELQTVKHQYPDLPVIMSGGITCSEDIQKYLNLGCTAVAVGTLFAAASESLIGAGSKIKMISATYDDIVRFGQAEQNALVFDPVAGDSHNNTVSLVYGIKNPNKGLIFAGKGIDNIKAILPINDIVQELVKDLKF
jgi:NAD(P)H-dependent flavin oxidoreductase YrpB (nitropropane dioxygenase family)